MADHFGFDAPVPFDAEVQPSTLKVPGDDLGFARTAAGFWNSTLSPIEAAWLSATVARGGDAPRMSVVSEIVDDKGGLLWSAPVPSSDHRAITADTARAVTRMMETTVSEGTSYRAFHDGRGQSFLPNVPVAGKTGTLTDAQAQRFYTWFTGFAPSRPEADGVPRIPQVAVAVLVVNKPTWHVKANVLARELLREYFAREHTPGVTAPTSRLDSSVARRE
jgi:cell division protein FtsI/penicillin-binding protein 2